MGRIGANLIGARTATESYVDTQVDSLAADVGAAPLLVPPASISETDLTAWPLLEYFIGNRFLVVHGGTYRYVRWMSADETGNLQVAVVSLDGTSFTRVAHSGVVSMPIGTYVEYDLGEFDLDPGDYAVGLWVDNTTARFAHRNKIVIKGTQIGVQVNAGAGGLGASGTMTQGSRAISGLSIKEA